MDIYSGISLQCQLLTYLDKRGILIKMREKCEDFMKSFTTEMSFKFPPFRFLLEIDVMDLINIFPDVGKLLLAEPLQWKRYCDKILFACLKAVGYELAVTVQRNQVAVFLRMKNISQQMIRLNPRDYHGLVGFKGQLIDVSKSNSYVYHTVWSCPEECEGNEVISHCIPKTSPKCFMCKGSLYENSGLRRCGDQVIAKFKLSNNLLVKTFKIVDDLISKLELGSQYFITAVALKKSVEVWTIEMITPLAAPITCVVANDIKELYNSCDGLPWKFIYCLASTIGCNICPLNCFMQLKINILLSLTSVKANSYKSSYIIHVLIVGFDSAIIGNLMNEGAKLVDTSLILGTANNSVPTALIGSSGGICLMPLPLHAYNSQTTSAILASIESGEIVSESSRTKLKGAVWAQGMDFKKIVIFNVASVFGTICRGDYGEYEDELAEFTFRNAMESKKKNSEETQAMKDVAHYIDVVAGIQVELDSKAEVLLTDYFLAVRKERPRGISVSSMQSLVATCLNSARLCRRSVANTEDALFAIWLHVSGYPEPRFAPDEYLQTPADIKQLQKVFKKFKDWLTEFTSTHGY